MTLMASLPLKRLAKGHFPLRWLQRSTFAVSEQLMVAGANFLLNLAFARWGDRSEYGAFSFVQSLFLFSAVIYTAFFTEPMMVFVHREFSTCRGSYYRIVLQAQAIFLAFVAIAFLAIGAVLNMAGWTSIGGALQGFAMAGPALLWFGLLRRIWYCEDQPGKVALAATLYLAATLAAVFVLRHFQWMNSFRTLVANTLCATAGIVFLLISLDRRSYVDGTKEQSPTLTKTLRLHWNYARWSLSSGVASWLPANVGPLMLSVWGTLAVLGAFRALVNFIQPLLQVVTALTGISLPLLARHCDDRRFWWYAKILLVCCSFLGSIYTAALIGGGRELVGFVYSGKFTDQGGLLTILALTCLCTPAIAAANAILRAQARPDMIFFATVSGAATALILGPVATIYFGAVGAGFAMLFAYLVNLIVVVFGLAKLRSCAVQPT